MGSAKRLGRFSRSPASPARVEVERFASVRALRSRWALLSFATLVHWLGNQGVRPFFALRLRELGASDLTIGLAVAAYALIGLVMAVPSGRLLDRLPQNRLLIGTLLLLAASTGVLPILDSVPGLSAGMVLNGLFAMWTWLLLQSMATRAGEGVERRRQLALFSLAWGIGQAAGPSAGAFVYDRLHFSGVCVVIAFVTLAGALTSIAIPRLQPVREEAGEGRGPRDEGMRAALRRSLGNPILVSVLVSSFITLFVTSMRSSFYPVYLQDKGVSLTRIGLLLSVIGVASLAVRTVLPPAERRFGTTAILVGTTWLAIAGAAAIPLSTSMPVLLAGAAVMGLGIGANPPITVTLLAEHSDARDRGLAVGLRMVANRSAQVAQPAVAGALAGFIGLGLTFPVSAAALAVLTVWMAGRLRRQMRAPSPEETGAAAPAPGHG